MRVTDASRAAEGPAPIRVLIALELRLYRYGLQALIEHEPDIVVAGEASDGITAVEQAAALRPDVVLLDLALAGLGTADVIRQIRRQEPAPRVLLLAFAHEEAQAIEALEWGAGNYLLKSAAPDRVMWAIRALAGASGALPLGAGLPPPSPARPIAPPSAGPDYAPPAPPALTAREEAVLELIARGYRNRDVAEELGLTEKAVKRSVSAILLKWHLDDRTQAVIYAMQHGILDPRTTLSNTPRAKPRQTA